MREAEQVSSLIAGIYDAALDPSLWPAVLRAARGYVGGYAAGLFSRDPARQRMNVYYGDGGVEPSYKRTYAETYRKLDPFVGCHIFADIDQPFAIADLMPYEEFLGTRYCQEWMRPQGLVDFVTATLDKSATSAAMFGIFRHERDGRVDEGSRRRMRLVAPHVRRAVLIGRAIDLKTAEAATFADTLDGLSAGMFLVDEAGRLVHANASGHAMLDERSVLHAPGGKLAAKEAKVAHALNETFAMAGGGDAAVGVSGIVVSMTARDGERYVAHVLPLTSGARRCAGAGYAAVAAMFVQKAELEMPSPPEIIAKTFKLTPSELRVLVAVVQVGGVAETAEALGVGEATVKTHLHRLFGKTGASRQADLVKLVAGYANPIVGEPKRLAPRQHPQPIGGRDAIRLLAS